ncbi:MAG: hypothetical protein HY064_14990 [Bacteroidetes bacterium]|nr:hypothetical protein [Bacteroidota bacterium]
MFRKIFFTSLLSFCYFISQPVACFAQALAQTDSTKHKLREADSTFSNHAFYIKTTPLTLLDFMNGGSANLIIESHPLQKISVSMEMGFYYPFAAYNMKQLYGWRSGFELRYYYRKSIVDGKEMENFIGVRYLYRKQEFDMHDSIFIDKDMHYEKNYHISRVVNIADFTCGIRMLGPKNFENEFYFGLGIRYKESAIRDLTQQEIDDRNWGDSFIFPILMKSGNYFVPDVLFGLKIGFGLK